MYHLALYFDEKTNQKLSFLSEQIKDKLHQNYLEEHHIPFHLTIATYKEIAEKKSSNRQISFLQKKRIKNFILFR